MFLYTETDHLVRYTPLFLWLCYERIDSLKGMQIKEIWIDFTTHMPKENCISVLPEPEMIDPENNFCLLWQWTGEMVSNKTMVATTVTSEIASANLDYRTVDCKVL